MAKSKPKQQVRRNSAATSTETDTSKKSSYTVRTHITFGDKDADGVTDVYEVGDTIELTDAEAEKMPWAVEKEGAKRSGQTSRLKQKVSELQARIKQLEEDNRRTKAGDDPNLEAAAESLKNRGDNYIARGEPTPGGVPNDALDAHDRQVLADDLGGSDDDDDTTELAGGMKGLGREKASGPVGSQAGGSGADNT